MEIFATMDINAVTTWLIELFSIGALILFLLTAAVNIIVEVFKGLAQTRSFFSMRSPPFPVFYPIPRPKATPSRRTCHFARDGAGISWKVTVVCATVYPYNIGEQPLPRKYERKDHNEKNPPPHQKGALPDAGAGHGAGHVPGAPCSGR